MIRMNYLNEETNSMEEVCVVGYLGDSAHINKDYAECYNEERGMFILPFTKLYASTQTTKDILDIMCEGE